jgi:chromate transport protein ChrA
MIAFAFGVARLQDLSPARWLHGLKLAALPVVAQAVWSMGNKLCADRARALIAALSAATILVLPSSLTQLAMISLGALVFGGGRVVLPLLRELVVGRGWLDDARFLAVYGAAQAIPGPLLTFAGFIGASMGPSAPSISGGLVTLLAIFAHACLLIAGALPFWHVLREKAWALASSPTACSMKLQASSRPASQAMCCICSTTASMMSRCQRPSRCLSALCCGCSTSPAKQGASLPRTLCPGMRRSLTRARAKNYRPRRCRCCPKCS